MFILALLTYIAITYKRK
ncbi:hypothetical protein [Paenibacillus hexagrammi]